MQFAITVEQIAAFCHSVNRSICLAVGDDSQPEWHEASEALKQSAIKGVLFRINHPNSTPADQHKAWVEDKLAEGWRRGDVKCTVAKTHPCLVPYVDLPFEQRVKDSVFQTIVDLLAPLLDYGRPEPADFEPVVGENLEPVVGENPEPIVGSPMEQDGHPIQEGAPVEPR